MSRSLRKTIRQQRYEIRFDTSFGNVIDHCAGEREGSEGTWITAAIRDAFVTLHQLGHAHCVESWNLDGLVGGIYGLAIGRVFFGESMFSHARDASKVALAALMERLELRGYVLLDCQLASPHLESLGSRAIPRQEFTAYVDRFCGDHETPGAWTVVRPEP